MTRSPHETWMLTRLGPRADVYLAAWRDFLRLEGTQNYTLGGRQLMLEDLDALWSIMTESERASVLAALESEAKAEASR